MKYSKKGTPTEILRIDHCVLLLSLYYWRIVTYPQKPGSAIRIAWKNYSGGKHAKFMEEEIETIKSLNVINDLSLYNE